MADDGVVHLGARLREARERHDLSLRAVARELDFSPSFLSQIENGKSQPSVATLYDLAQLLDVPIDELFQAKAADDRSRQGDGGSANGRGAAGNGQGASPSVVNRFDPGEVGTTQRTPRANVSIQRPGEGRRIELENGVIWTQLASNTGEELEFIEVVYPVGSSSTSDGAMLRHVGYEYCLLLEGQLEVTVGFDVHVLEAGDSMGLNSSTPHLFRNTGDVPARGVWFVSHII